MNRFLFTAALLALLGCNKNGLPEPVKEQLDKVPDPLTAEPGQGVERLASLDVWLDYDPAAAGCVGLVDGKLPDPSVAGDYCPDGPGSPDKPLLFQSGRPVRVLVTVTAISTGGTWPLPLSGNVALSSNVATLYSGTPVVLTQGRAERQPVRFVNGPGRVQVWAESNTALRQPDGTLVAPTFSMGSSDILWFGQPGVQDVQRTPDDASSPLDGRRVDLDASMLVVTRLASNGFTVQDINSQPGLDGKAWNGLFVFAYNGAEGLVVGSRLLKLKGAITEFQGMTQLAEPEFSVVGGECAPKAATSRYGVEEHATEEGATGLRARCPTNAECRPVDGFDRCMPKVDAVPYNYDRFGRITCTTPTAVGTPSAECPAKMQCLDRAEWNGRAADGSPLYTCQVSPTVVTGEALWTNWCGPNWTGITSYLDNKLFNESYEGALLQVNGLTVAGLDLTNDFFRSGFEGFGQWKALTDSGMCITVVSESAPEFDALAAQASHLKLKSIVGTLRQVRFKSGSAFWMLDLRHKDDLAPVTSP